MSGSKTAKKGFEFEKSIENLFNNWQSDKTAKSLLRAFGFNKQEITSLEVQILSGLKTDVQIKLTLNTGGVKYVNIQTKRCNADKLFNQVDKRWVDDYKLMWNIPDKLTSIFKKYTGESVQQKLNANELPYSDTVLLLSWLNDNKFTVLHSILKGECPYSADYLLVGFQNGTLIKYKKMNSVIDLLANFNFSVTNQGVIQLGSGLITIQKKGGDGNKPKQQGKPHSSEQLQFKIGLDLNHFKN